MLAPLATPLTIWVMFTVLYVIGAGWFADKRYSLVLDNVVVYALVGTPIAYVVTLAGGVPGYRLLFRRGRLSLSHFVVLGAVLGALPFVVFDIAMTVWGLSLGGRWLEPPLSPWIMFLATICGSASSAAFRALGVRMPGRGDVTATTPTERA